MFDFIYIGFAELWWTGSTRKNKNVSQAGIEPATLRFEPGALDHSTTTNRG